MKSSASRNKELVARLTADLLEVHTHLDATELREKQLREDYRALYDDVQHVRDDNFTLRSRLLELQPDKQRARAAESAEQLRLLQEEVDQLQEQLEAGGREQKIAKKSKSWVKLRFRGREHRDREQLPATVAMPSVEEAGEVENDAMQLRTQLEEVELYLHSESEDAQQMQCALEKQLADSEQHFQEELARRDLESKGLRAELEEQACLRQSDTVAAMPAPALQQRVELQAEVLNLPDMRVEGLHIAEMQAAGLDSTNLQQETEPPRVVFDSSDDGSTDGMATHMEQQHMELMLERDAHQNISRELGDEHSAFRNLQSRFEQNCTGYLDEAKRAHAAESKMEELAAEVQKLQTEEKEQLKKHAHTIWAAERKVSEQAANAGSSITELKQELDRLQASSNSTAQRGSAAESMVSKLTAEVEQFQLTLASSEVKAIVLHEEVQRLEQAAIDESHQRDARSSAVEAIIADLKNKVEQQCASSAQQAQLAETSESNTLKLEGRVQTLQAAVTEEGNRYAASEAAAEATTSELNAKVQRMRECEVQGDMAERRVAELMLEIKHLKSSRSEDTQQTTTEGTASVKLSSEVEHLEMTIAASEAQALDLTKQVEQLKQAALEEAQMKDSASDLLEQKVFKLKNEVDQYRAHSADLDLQAHASENKIMDLVKQVQELQMSNQEYLNQSHDIIGSPEKEASEQAANAESSNAELQHELERLQASSNSNAQFASAAENRVATLFAEVEQFQVTLAASEAKASISDQHVEQLRQAAFDEYQQREAHNTAMETIITDLKGQVDKCSASSTDEARRASFSEREMQELANEVQILQATALEKDERYAASVADAEVNTSELNMEVQQVRACELQGNMAERQIAELKQEVEYLVSSKSEDVHHTTAEEATSVKLSGKVENLEMAIAASEAKASDMTTQVEQLRHALHEESQEKDAAGSAAEETVVKFRSEMDQYQIYSADLARRAHASENKMAECADEIQKLRRENEEQRNYHKASISAAELKASDLQAEVERLRQAPLSEPQGQTHERDDNWHLLEQAMEELAAKDEELLQLRQQVPRQPSGPLDGVGGSMVKNSPTGGPAMAAKLKKDVTKIGSKLKSMDMSKLGGKFGLQNLGAKMSGSANPDSGLQPEVGMQQGIDSHADVGTPSGKARHSRGASLMD